MNGSQGSREERNESTIGRWEQEADKTEQENAIHGVQDPHTDVVQEGAGSAEQKLQLKCQRRDRPEKHP